MKKILNLAKNKKNLQNKNVIKDLTMMENWKNFQKILVDHTSPKKFEQNKKIVLICSIKFKNNFFGYLHYRHVNQSIKWKKIKLNKEDKKFTASIPASYTKTPFPIQYYFELINNKISSFAPGFSKNLSNQPYYILRKNI